jgi:hypothetical protein
MAALSSLSARGKFPARHKPVQHTKSHRNTAVLTIGFGSLHQTGKGGARDRGSYYTGKSIDNPVLKHRIGVADSPGPEVEVKP